MWYDPLGIPASFTAGQGANLYSNCDALWEDVSSFYYGSWSPANTSIATADYYGTHTGVAVGSTTSSISARLNNAYYRLCPITGIGGSGGDNVKPTIMFNGQNINGTTQSVVVGQQIALTASYGNITPTSQSWTVPGTVVGGFSTGLNNGGPNPVSLSGQSTTFYWAAAATSQTVTFTVNYGSSQTASASATFNISGVTSPLIGASVGNWKIGTAPNLQLGDVTSTPGITFTKSATPPLGYPGAFEWVQVITKSNIACKSSSGTKNVNETPGLDSSYPYSSSATASDTPSIPLASADNEITWDFAANMYLMWRPGLTNDIYVPLGYVTWQFFGDASQSGAWTVQSDSSRSANAFVQSSSYPTWTSTLPTNAPPPCP